jgi:uncharacterized membrane protein YeaQ/YmgE (transglycosylase-associated protein family)
MTIAGIISAIIVGLIVGALGRLVVPGKQHLPIWLTILLGVAGAFSGSAIARAAHYADTAGFDWLEFFTQIGVAAVLVLVISGYDSRRRRRRILR